MKKEYDSFNRIKLKNKIQGMLEETLSRGTVSIIAWLAVTMILTVVIFSFVLVLMNLRPDNETGSLSLIEAIWQNFLRVIDPGGLQNDRLWGYRIVSAVVTLLGVLIFGALVGVLTTGLDNLFIEIRKGKTEIVKKDFTLILGWNPTIFKIISELVISNANHKNKKIVILSKNDKIKMEDEINLRINQKELLKNFHNSLGEKSHKTYQTKIYCRSGSIIDTDDLNIVHPENAESVIILSSEEDKEDINTIKCILALRKKAKKIITEIKDEHNKELMDFCFQNGENKNILYIPSEKWLSRITAQASRQPGFSVIATEILNYDNDEIYFSKAGKELIGRTFKEISLNCTTSIVLGMYKKNLDKKSLKGIYQAEIEEGKLPGIQKNIILNPYEKFHNNIINGENIGCVIEEGDELILFQSDDGYPEFFFEDLKIEKFQWKNSMEDVILPKSKTLILGYNKRIYKIINELYEYVSTDSEVHIIAKMDEEVEKQLKENFGSENVTNEDITDYKISEKEYAGEKFNLESYESIIILGYDNLETQEKDAKSMLTMLLIKKLLEKNNKCALKEKSIVIEIYDEKNREIVELTEVSDYIISDTIISSVISQLSEEKRLYYVFDELFSGEGCEIYMFSADNYIENFNREYTFKELSTIVANEGTILLGYRDMSERVEKKKDYGVHLNINKNNKIKLNKNDKLIVLFEGGNERNKKKMI
nr:hypothetical protein [uncultured Leptotrichia sp.]